MGGMYGIWVRLWRKNNQISEKWLIDREFDMHRSREKYLVEFKREPELGKVAERGALGGPWKVLFQSQSTFRVDGVIDHRSSVYIVRARRCVAEWVSAHAEQLERPEARARPSSCDLHEPTSGFRVKV